MHYFKPSSKLESLDIINQIAVELLSLNTTHEIVRSVINNITSKLKLEDCAIYLIDDSNKYLVKKANTVLEEKSEYDSRTKIAQIKIGEGIVGKVALNKEYKITVDTSLEEDYLEDEEFRFSEITIPILHQGKLIGVLDSEHPQKDFYNQYHLEILLAIASMMGAKIIQAKRLERLYMKEFQMDAIDKNTHDLVFLIAVEPNDVFRYISVNQALLKRKIFHNDKLEGKTLGELWNKEKEFFFISQYKKCIKSKKPMTYEVSVDNVSPEIIAETTVTPVFDNLGNCLTISGISRDVTKRKKAKKALQDSKAQFESLFEYSPYSILIHDFKKITNVNQSFLELFQYQKKDEIIGNHPIETIVHNEDYQIIQRTKEKVKIGNPTFTPSIRMIKKDGSIFIAEIYVSTVHLDDVTHLRISIRDISEEKLAEQTILESEKKYRMLYENSLDGIYKSTPNGKFVDVNPAMVKMLGYESEEELLNIDIKKELYFNIEDRVMMAVHDDDQYPLKRKDGSEIWVEDHGRYEKNIHGEIVFHHGILRDVSAKVEKQKELENLFAVTADQNDRLQNFAHIVSHNIRSHSSNMSSLVHFMETVDDEVEKSKLFEMLKTSTNKLEETIKNLNEIITVNQNLKKSKEQKNLYTEINNTLKVLSGDIRKNDISIIIDMPSDLIVKVIPAYLDSILLNILSNAIKYRFPGRESRIIINTKKIKNYTVLSFCDNGIGLDLNKNRNKIFGMYETFHDNKDSRGFGLYITKNQILAMDGKIEVESKVDVGSTFNVYFNDKS